MPDVDPSAAARTAPRSLTPELRRAIRDGEDSLRSAAKRYGVNLKTAAKWRRRSSVEDGPSGPRPGRGTALTPEEERIAVSFRRNTALPLDDCLYALRVSIPRLTRSTLYRCLRRHGAMVAAQGEEVASDTVRFYVDAIPVVTDVGAFNVHVATELSSKFAFLRIFERCDVSSLTSFLGLLSCRPHPDCAIVTQRGDQLFLPAGSGHMALVAIAERVIAHRTHPGRSPGGTVRDHDTFLSDIHAFYTVYNFKRRLKAIGGIPPWEKLRRDGHARRFETWSYLATSLATLAEPVASSREPVRSGVGTPT